MVTQNMFHTYEKNRSFRRRKKRFVTALDIFKDQILLLTCSAAVSVLSSNKGQKKSKHCASLFFSTLGNRKKKCPAAKAHFFRIFFFQASNKVLFLSGQALLPPPLNS